MTPHDGTAHDCMEKRNTESQSRPDLYMELLTDGDKVFFVDESASREVTTGHRQAGYAVVEEKSDIPVCRICTSATSLPCPVYRSAKAASEQRFVQTPAHQIEAGECPLQEVIEIQKAAVLEHPLWLSRSCGEDSTTGLWW